MDATCQNCNMPINSTSARYCGECEAANQEFTVMVAPITKVMDDLSAELTRLDKILDDMQAARDRKLKELRNPARKIRRNRETAKP